MRKSIHPESTRRGSLLDGHMYTKMQFCHLQSFVILPKSHSDKSTAIVCDGTGNIFMTAD